MNFCGLCKTPIRKQSGDESKPDNLACWIHVTGYYQCPGSRSEFDLATYDQTKIVEAYRYLAKGNKQCQGLN